MPALRGTICMFKKGNPERYNKAIVLEKKQNRPGKSNTSRVQGSTWLLQTGD